MNILLLSYILLAHHPTKEGTLFALLKQAGISKQEVLEYLQKKG